MKKYNLAGALVLFAFGAAVSFEAQKLGIGRVSAPRAGFFPFWLGVSLLLSSGILVIKFLLSAEKKTSEDRVSLKGTSWKKILWVVTGVLLYAFLLEPVGYLVATTLLMIFLFRASESQRWLSVAVWSVAVSVLTYILFKIWLQVQFPAGFLGI
jgi:putative tricarboxylic transport membrane protein